MKTADISILDRNLQSEPAQNKTPDTDLRALIETLPVGIIFSDLAGRITDMNAEITRMFGYSREELVSRGIETSS